MIRYLSCASPFGMLLIGLEDGAVVSLKLAAEPLPEESPSPAVQALIGQLSEYFSGIRTEFDIPLSLKGTPFQMLVWQELRRIPYGQTRTYGNIAREMARITGKEKMSAQAVGQAVGSNPISIIIPCHRVVGERGKLTGYAWGIDKKLWLLRHEEAI